LPQKFYVCALDFSWDAANHCNVWGELLKEKEISPCPIVDNEFYVVLRNRPDLVQAMSPEEVARRWLRLSRWSLVLKPEPTAEQIKEELAKPGRLEELRRRLSSISWHMIMLKEPIARAANWKEAVRTISRRFRWLERTASAMRRDSRRFVADSGPPAG
jgi:hypothetical protein